MYGGRGGRFGVSCHPLPLPPAPLPPCAQAELNPLIGLAGYHLETLIQIRALSAIGQLLPNLIQTSFKSSSLVISTE